MSHGYFDKHKAVLDKAVDAIHARTYWSPGRFRVAQSRVPVAPVAAE